MHVIFEESQTLVHAEFPLDDVLFLHDICKQFWVCLQSFINNEELDEAPELITRDDLKCAFFSMGSLTCSVFVNGTTQKKDVGAIYMIRTVM